MIALKELALVFLKLGTVSFGGPAAHIALMRHEVVERRGWLTEQQFLDLLGAANLIPGPNSTEMAIFIGRARAGWRGILVAGGCFILPAALIVTAIAWAYTRFGMVPDVRAAFSGITPVVIAIIAVALVRLGRTAVRSLWLGAVAAVTLSAAAAGLNELAVLLLGALLGVAGTFGSGTAGRTYSAVGMIPGITVTGSTAVAATVPVSLGLLFGVFFKAGALLFGSGYVLLAFLRADLVQRLGWLSEHQLLDAVAVGQMTPGPVFTTATFIGYVLGGGTGAVVATFAIFVPAFVYVALSAPLVPRLRHWTLTAGVLDGVNVASMALMALVTWQLGRVAIVGPVTAAMTIASGVVLLTTRINAAWLIPVGALVGLLRGH